ncbi:MAG: uncharacterized protein KVP18_002680 [Porospora cf. gigantea A]|uniref:uncharacterized protein n=1 Tax=Porospora cf. gigantea A TaxID=2853593 RepID=UPI0035596287|nr:MAG: hypothetical protein KVP18_002680 [Porospora cf. gigantea A]
MNEQRAKLFGHATPTQDDTFMRSAAQLEEANDETVRQLSEKVDDLKSVSSAARSNLVVLRDKERN